VNVQSQQQIRDFKDIKSLINKSKLDDKVKNLSIKIFAEIAKAESKVHGKPINSVHFHEVGALDSIVEIVCTAISYSCLDIDFVYSRKIPLGKGVASTMHGSIPIPAPATLEVLKGIPVYGGDFDFEMTTPTGAAIIKALVNDFRDIPEMTVKKIGMGAGKTEGKNIPNILRLLYGSTSEKSLDKISEAWLGDLIIQEKSILLSTNIDDSTPEIIGYLLDKLFKSDVLDAWVETIYMKKNRPAFKVCALCKLENLANTLTLIFSETSTIGIRAEEIKRFILKRELKRVKLPYGEVIVKVAVLNGREITLSPEYDSCANLAKRTGKPLKEIYQDAVLFLSSK
jgi:uncharacterized protein (TIGR00299 family) protein